MNKSLLTLWLSILILSAAAQSQDTSAINTFNKEGQKEGVWKEGFESKHLDVAANGTYHNGRKSGTWEYKIANIDNFYSLFVRYMADSSILLYSDDIAQSGILITKDSSVIQLKEHHGKVDRRWCERKPGGYNCFEASIVMDNVKHSTCATLIDAINFISYSNDSILDRYFIFGTIPIEVKYDPGLPHPKKIDAPSK